MSKVQIKIPEHIFRELSIAASARTKMAKSIIIEDDGFNFKFLTEDYQGNIVIAGYATHPNQLKQSEHQ